MRQLKNYIEINNNRKGGPCCSKSIDISRGCKNNCKFCYKDKSAIAAIPEIKNKSVFYKRYDDEKFKKSCISNFKKGQRNIRLGKFSEPGDPANNSQLNDILAETKNQKLKLVMVSKSVSYSKQISKNLKNGSHTLHVSLGMSGQTGPSNEERIAIYKQFKADGVNSKVRLVLDTNKPMPLIYKDIPIDDVIITPLRYASMEHLLLDKADPKMYKFESGYYRVTKIHKDYSFYHFCGKVGNKELCSSCLVK